MGRTEVPIFFDARGRRWRLVKLITAGLVSAAVAGLLVVVPGVWSLQRPGAPAADTDTVRTAGPTPEEVVSTMNAANTPVVGSGPLVRVLQVRAQAAGMELVEPFTGVVAGTVTEAHEKLALIGEPYVLQRYGNESKKRLFLTFDDGPDPRYTPALLDMLAEEGVAATFFVVGANVVKHPDIARRIVREGHGLANHTFTHIAFDQSNAWRRVQEINQTERVIRATSAHSAALFRPPYVGESEQALRNSARGLVLAQSMGYINAVYDFDSNDWQFASRHVTPHLPDLGGNDDKTILLHDAGGDRSATLGYVRELIRQAKQKGYGFAGMQQLQAARKDGLVPVAPQRSDAAAMTAAAAVLVWPRKLVISLFVMTLTLVITVSLLNIVLAVLHKRDERRRTFKHRYAPAVTVIVPAYNEGVVVAKTVESLLGSSYTKLDFLLVDDGSTDDTWEVMQSLAARYPTVRAMHQENAGKAGALNMALEHTHSDIVVCVDADTVFPPETIGNLVRHFHDRSVGAVAGVVRVGNVRGVITRWQALEYAVSIGLERNAQARLGSIMVVPGACGAWRRRYVQAAGGFSRRTMAEDSDMTLALQQRGYRVVQDNEAISFTEAPADMRSLMKQRFRWTFGIVQVLWAYRGMMLRRRYGWLGLYSMPASVVTTLMPLLFWPVLVMLSVENIAAGNYRLLALYAALSLAFQAVLATIALRLGGRHYAYLWALPFARFVFAPVRGYILARAVVTGLRGRVVGWGTLLRTGSVTQPPLALPTSSAALSK